MVDVTNRAVAAEEKVVDVTNRAENAENLLKQIANDVKKDGKLNRSTVKNCFWLQVNCNFMLELVSNTNLSFINIK